MEICNPAIQAYAEKYSSQADPVLAQIIEHTTSTHSASNMLSGHLQGKFLEIFSILLQPKCILEIGTFVGYSAICLARGLKDTGELHTIEIREEEAVIAKSNFNRTNDSNKIILHIGNALEIIPTLDKLWDIVFIDADKSNYIAYYKLVLPRLRTGGVILADNVLFHGEVLQEPITGKNAKSIQAFNDYVQQDDSVEKLMLTIRDGLLLIRKK